MLDEIVKVFPDLGGYAVKVLGALFALWIAFRIAAWGQRVTLRSLKKRDFDVTLSQFFSGLVRYLILISAVLAVLSIFGIETTSFAAIIGAAGLAIGLAFQGTLGNFASGVMILTFRPFSVGDYVKVAGGMEGTVRDIGLFVCALDTLDNRRVIVPNSKVTGDVLENYWGNEFIRVDINVGVSYDADLSKVRDVLDKAAAAVPNRDPKNGHQIFLLGLGGSSVDFQVRVWCKPENYWGVWDATTEIVKKSLDHAGISIPYPQMDVHMDKVA